MATAKKLPSGSWRCQVYSHTEPVIDKNGAPVIDSKTGKQKQRRIYRSFTCDIPGPKGKRQCEKEAATWAANKEQTSKQSDMTLDTAMKKYIELRTPVLSPRTIMDYTRMKDKDLTTLAPILLSRITQEDIQKTVNVYSQNHSPKSTYNLHGFLSAVLGVYRPDLILKTVLPKKVRPNLYIPSDGDIKRLMAHIENTEMELPILLAAFGPMRRGEICALSTDDINGNLVHVCRNMVRDTSNNWIIKSPKTYDGDRYIEYPSFVSEKWKGREGRLVLLTPDSISNRFSRILKNACINHFRFHDLRHYSASIQHALGIPDAYIMQRGGWKNDGVLKNIYRHAMEDKALQMSAVANSHFEKLYGSGMQHEMQHKTEKPS